MIFSGKTVPGELEERSALVARIVGLVLEGCALHAVEFDSEAHRDFRSALRSIARRFEKGTAEGDFLVLAGETNVTLQLYGKAIEKHIGLITAEKHRAISLLTESFLRVCHSSQESAQALRAIEVELRNASQLEDMRLVRGRLAVAIETLCEEGKRQEQRAKDLLQEVSGTDCVTAVRDRITGLPTLKHAEARINEVVSCGRRGVVVGFFLKNIEVVNRRFGFVAGDTVLKRFSEYLTKSYTALDELCRWRGPCFVVISERPGALETFRVEADKIASRGPREEVEGAGKSMLFQLTAATTVFPISKEHSNCDFVEMIDRFASQQVQAFRASGA